MDNDLLTKVKIFEEACKDFNQANDAIKRQRADLLLQQFQDQLQPYEFCRIVLERKENAYACFVSATILRRAIVREWSVVGDSMLNLYLIVKYLDVKSSLCGFVMTYIINTNP